MVIYITNSQFMYQNVACWCKQVGSGTIVTICFIKFKAIMKEEEKQVNWLFEQIGSFGIVSVINWYFLVKPDVVGPVDKQPSNNQLKKYVVLDM